MLDRFNTSISSLHKPKGVMQTKSLTFLKANLGKPKI